MKVALVATAAVTLMPLVPLTVALVIEPTAFSAVAVTPETFTVPAAAAVPVTVTVTVTVSPCTAEVLSTATLAVRPLPVTAAAGAATV